MNSCLQIDNKIALASLLLGLVSTEAEVFYVPADHATIQAAVKAAGANDTIQIPAGVYVDQVVITNSFEPRNTPSVR